jgi:hypothetical protein
MQLGTHTTSVNSHAMGAQAPAGGAERPGTGLVDGCDRGHVEDDSLDGAAADLIRAGGEVLYTIEIEAAGQRHGEPAPAALFANDELIVRASGRLMTHS